MSKFLMVNVPAKTLNRKHDWQNQKSPADLRQSAKTPFGKPLASNHNGGRRGAKPSRATRILLARRLREIRERKGLSQGDISRVMAVRRAYISRVESAGHVPPLPMLQRWARVLEVPLYQFFYGGKTPPEQLQMVEPELTTEVAANGSHDRYFRELWRLLPRLTEPNRKFLLEMAEAVHRRRPRRLLFAQPRAVPRAISR